MASDLVPGNINLEFSEIYLDIPVRFPRITHSPGWPTAAGESLISLHTQSFISPLLTTSHPTPIAFRNSDWLHLELALFSMVGKSRFE
ncbi:hypothetical protein [Bifidobacterium asteroides]|uniref:hypothetical protein n=1 Tax=Bifidobacterium asteroides TaxID=1684 RepID=UPI003A801CA0